jgi:transcription antitermination factor NusA-like protein
LVTGVVSGWRGTFVLLKVESRPAVMPPFAQLPGEALKVGQQLALVIDRTRSESTDGGMLVSRTRPALLARLLEAHVPAIADGSVRIMRLARIPGIRSKVAVVGLPDGPDPVAACLGPGGVHVRTVCDELGKERVDFVPWSEDPTALIKSAIGRPEVNSVRLDECARTAEVSVPPRSVMAANGLRGTNAILASRLTRWSVTIVAGLEVDAEPQHSSASPGSEPSRPAAAVNGKEEIRWRQAKNPELARSLGPVPAPAVLRVQLTEEDMQPPITARAPRRREPTFDDLACVDAVQRVAILLGHSPSPGEYQEVRRAGTFGVLPSPATVVNKVGGWSDAVELAALMPEPEATL